MRVLARGRTLIATLALLAVVATAAAAQTTEATRAKVMVLMERIGISQIANQLNAQMLRELGPLVEQALKQEYAAAGKEMPPDLFAIAMEEMQASMDESMPAFLELIAAEYVALFTEEEIDQMIAFYDSPLGQKVIRTQPERVRRSAALGQAWGREADKAAMVRALAWVRVDTAH